MVLAVIFLIFLALSNFGLALFNLHARYIGFANSLTTVKLLIPMLIVILLWSGTKSALRTLGLILFIPIALLCTSACTFWLLIGRPSFDNCVEEAAICPSAGCHQDVSRGKLFSYITASDGVDDTLEERYRLFKVSAFGPFLYQVVDTAMLPTNLYPVMVNYHNEHPHLQLKLRDKIVMEATVEEILKHKTNLPE